MDNSCVQWLLIKNCEKVMAVSWWIRITVLVVGKVDTVASLVIGFNGFCRKKREILFRALKVFK